MPSGLAAISKASDFLNLLDIWSRSSGALGGLGADPAARRAHRDQALQGQGLATRFLKGLQWGVLEQTLCRTSPLVALPTPSMATRQDSQVMPHFR